MAVTKVPETSRLVVEVQTGLNAAGKPVYAARSYRNVKVSAADSDVYAIGQSIANLQKYALNSISRVDEGNLLNQ